MCPSDWGHTGYGRVHVRDHTTAPDVPWVFTVPDLPLYGRVVAVRAVQEWVGGGGGGGGGGQVIARWRLDAGACRSPKYQHLYLYHPPPPPPTKNRPNPTSTQCSLPQPHTLGRCPFCSMCSPPRPSGRTDIIQRTAAIQTGGMDLKTHKTAGSLSWMARISSRHLI